MDEVEIGWSARSRPHVILHPQPERPAGMPDYAMATACDLWLQGLQGNRWETPATAREQLACPKCRRFLRT